MKITAITPQIFASNKTQNKQSFVSAKAEKTYGGDVFVKSVTAKKRIFWRKSDNGRKIHSF